MQAKVDTGERVAEKVGLVDGGHVYIRCSNCEAILMDIWRTSPDAINPLTKKPFLWKIRANCPFCGDHSFITEVAGLIHAGGYGSPVPDDPEADIPSTCIDTQEVSNDTLHFTIRKANEHAKPVRTRT